MVFQKLSTRGSNSWSSFQCEGGSHVKHMHDVLLLIHPNFSSNLMITCLDLFENSLLIQFEQFESGSKVSFRQNRDTWPFNTKRNWSGSKPKRHAYASRDYLLHIKNWIKSWTPAYSRTHEIGTSVSSDFETSLWIRQKERFQSILIPILQQQYPFHLNLQRKSILSFRYLFLLEN